MEPRPGSLRFNSSQITLEHSHKSSELAPSLPALPEITELLLAQP